MRKIKSALSKVIPLIITFVPTGALAVTWPGQITRIEDLVQTIVNIVAALAGTILLIILLWGGITYMTAGGNEEQAGKGKKIVFDGIIGLVIVAAAWAIMRYVVGAFISTGAASF